MSVLALCSVRYTYLILQLWVLAVLLRAEVHSVSYNQRIYQVIENDNVVINCTANCSSSTRYFFRWHLQVPNYNNFAQLQITNTIVEEIIEERFGIGIEYDQNDVCNGTRTYELQLIGVGVALNHSVVECSIFGSEGTGTSEFGNGGVSLIVNRIEPEVSTNRDVYYATPSGVRIECTHTCGWSSQTPITYLWRLRMFGPTHQEVLDLHNTTIRVSLEQELGVRVNMTAEGCEGNGNTSSFYLDIVGISGHLQHALVTCGVRTDHQDMYSHTHCYIVINMPMPEATRDVYYASPSGVRIKCTHTCGRSSQTPITYLWRLRMSDNTYQEVMDLHNATTRASLEQELGVRVNMTAEGCEGNRNTSSFYLDIVGMNGCLQHALVTCGVRTEHQDLYSHTHSYIVINTPTVSMPRLIHVVNETGTVVIECTHTCTGGVEPEYLWQLRTYRDMLPQNLHVANVTSNLEDQLGINISIMGNQSGTCDGGNRSFYLKMSGLGTSLNHSVVSCGVRQINIYTVYSQQDSYILIREDENTPTSLTTPTSLATSTSLPTTNPAPEVSAALEKVLPPSLLAALLVGAVIGAIVVVVVMPILRRFFSKRHQTRGGESIPGPVNLCSMEDSNIFKNGAADSK